MGIGLEPTSDGPSVEFSSVSSSEESGPTEDSDKNGSSRRMRLQLRAVYSGLKDKIKHESDLVTEIVRGRTNRFDKRATSVEEVTETVKTDHEIRYDLMGRVQEMEEK